MTILYAKPLSGDFDIDQVINQMQSSCKSLVNLGDTFERERQQLEFHIEELANEGTPIRNPTLLFRRLDMRRETIGPSTDVEITSVSGIHCSGHVARTRVYLELTDPNHSRTELNEITHLLEACSECSVDVLESDCDD